jgi:hypothetical protein
MAAVVAAGGGGLQRRIKQQQFASVRKKRAIYSQRAKLNLESFRTVRGCGGFKERRWKKKKNKTKKKGEEEEEEEERERWHYGGKKPMRSVAARGGAR